VRRPDLFGEACRQLGWPGLEADRRPLTLFDGMVFNPDDPLGYIRRFSLHRDLQVAEIALEPAPSPITP
jgi:nitrate/nitrite transport system ATP-binding protein